MSDPLLVTRTTVVPTTPAEVFALLADPHRHVDLDGSGTLVELLDGTGRRTLGAEFSMRMNAGARYTVRNTVVEFVEGVRIGWRHRARHVWRYELAAVDGGTAVTETWDGLAKRAPRLVTAIGMPRSAAAAIEATLDGLRSRLADVHAA